MFHLVSFLQVVAVVPDIWVNGGQCSWPKLRGENLTKAVKTKQQAQKEWKKYSIRILYTAGRSGIKVYPLCSDFLFLFSVICFCNLNFPEKFDDTRKKLPQAELLSDIQSDTSGVKMLRQIV